MCDVMVPQIAQAIRLLLKYTETEFEDVLYEQGEGMHASQRLVLSCV